MAQTLDYSFVTVGCNRIAIDLAKTDAALATQIANGYDTTSTANLYALNRTFTEVMALSPRPKFVFLTGDIVMGYRTDTVYLAKELQSWKSVYYNHAISTSGIKVIVVPGNHETQSKPLGKKSTVALERTFVREMKDFIYGSNGPTATGLVAGTDSLTTDQSKLTYSFNYKNDHFIILNTDPTGRDSRVPFRWLKADLKANPARHTFAFGHKPALSSKFKPLDGLEAFTAQKDSFWTIFENAHAEAMFAAHEHVWDTIRSHAGKTLQVIAGNGGSDVETTWNASPYNYHGFTLVEVYTNNQIVCKSLGHTIPTHYMNNADANPTSERANFRLETGVVINHTPLTNTKANGPFTVTATLNDNLGVAKDTLMYWVNGVMSKVVASVSGNTYTYTIPAQNGSGIIEYAIKAIDGFGQVSLLPANPIDHFKFSFGPIAVSKYTLNKSAKLGTYLGQDIFLAGFSGLSSIKGTNDQFFTVTDRGPNLDAKNSGKLFALPNFHPQIIKFKIAGDSIQIMDTISIKRPNGTPTTGLVNPTGGGGTGENAISDTLGTTVTPDIWGIDSEGIAEGNKNDFWISEEYGTSVWNVEKATGKVIHRYAPFKTLQPEDIKLDTVFSYRNSNKGLEGVAVTPNGKAYAFIQNTLLYKGTSKTKTQLHRFVEIDPATNKTRMFLYEHDKVPASGALSTIANDKRYIGDAVAINNNEFLILEHGKSTTESYAKIYKITLDGTVIDKDLYTGKAIEEYNDSTTAAGQGVKVVTKKLFLDLIANGYDPTIEKQEGLAIVNDSTIAVVNDNDFGVISPNADGKVVPNNVKTVLYSFTVPQAQKLNLVAPAGTNTNSTAYIQGTKPGVDIKPLLTVGDDVKGYKMVGIPDGLGAFDNGNGTFTLLMNHELGNDKGIVRAHGSKGTFVSKWTINKNDLSVVAGEDLMKNLFMWDSVNQVSKSVSSTIALNRFCSADLPAVSAYYNKNTGKGTQERIFMNGEEGGAHGYALAHVVTGAGAGNSYVLGKFNLATNGSGINSVGGWENLLANPYAQDKTIVIGNNDGGTNQMNNSVAVYVGTKTTTGTDADKAGLTNGVVKFVSVTGNPVEVVNTTTRATNIALTGTAFTLKDTASTFFSRPEDGAWDPKDPSKFYFVTTDRLDKVKDGLDAVTFGRSRLWRLNFTDITNPDLGGTIDMLLDGTEGQNMFDNMTIDKYGHILLLEDVGGNAHNGKVWQYSIDGDSSKIIAMHDAARFGDINKSATAPFNNDEETSGIIDMEDILGAGNFLLVDQAHYATTTELVEGGQLLRLFNPDTYKGMKMATKTGPTTSTTPYIQATKPGVDIQALLSVGDSVGVNKYKMVGIPDGLGAFDNGNGTFTLLMNHELGNDKGIVRAHGSKGTFVSKWTINKNDLSVVAGEDLMKNLFMWDSVNQVSKSVSSTIALNRFCSADLPAVSAYYNKNTGKGTQERIFMNGEEGGAHGYALAHVVTGAGAGNSYVLGKFNLATNGSGINSVGGWENLLANPYAQDKTIVIGNNDGGTNQMNNSVAVYVGTKTTTGTDADKAGLTNGVVKFVSVTGNPVEVVNTTTRATNIALTGTAFTLKDTASTFFSRPEDGAWDPKDPSKFYFVTTDRLDKVKDGLDAVTFGRSRLWRLNFTDITNPDLGGTIDMLLDGTEGQNMFDNMTIDKYGHILLLEDVGGNAHNGKVWQYSIDGDSSKIIAMHDAARFGDINKSATAPFNNDEETSGIIDMEDILGAGNFLLVDQAHYATTTELVEGGQLLRLFNPDTYAASKKLTGVETAESSTLQGVSLYPNPSDDNVTVAFNLENTEAVTVTVYDNQGKAVITTVRNDLSAGANKVSFNTTNLTSGIYVVEVATSTKVSRIKAVVIH